MKPITGTALGTITALSKKGPIHDPILRKLTADTLTSNFLDVGRALATTSTYCPNGFQDICFRWGVPEESASSGSGNIYFQIEAATSYQWVGLGIGSRMSGSDIFVIYQDGSGNVTLSTRTGTGHVMPQYSERSDVQLLAGSGVINKKMVANIRCGDCDGLKLGGTNSWIAAFREGNSLNSMDLQATIQQHDNKGSFSVNFAEATIESDSNPFVDSSSNDSSGGSRFDFNGSGDGDYTLVYSHGIVMSVVFLIGYPIGAVLMPLLGNWLVHAGWQVLGFLGMWAGFGIGYVIAGRYGYVSLATPPNFHLHQYPWCLLTSP